VDNFGPYRSTFVVGETSNASSLYVIASESSSSNLAQLRKYNTQDGNLIWEKNLVSGFQYNFSDGIVASNDDVVLSLNYQEQGNKTYLLLRIDGNGNDVWQREFPFGLSVMGQTSGGGFALFAGDGQNSKGRVMKVNSEGLFDPVCANVNDELPDLAIAKFEISDNQFTVGETISYNYDVSNLSLVNSGPYTIRVAIEPSNISTTPFAIAEEYIVSDTPFGTNSYSGSFVIPSGLAGNYEFALKVDSENVVEEFTKFNNKYHRAISIDPVQNNLPNLTVSNIANLPNSGEVGEVVTFYYDSGNTGNVPTTGNFEIHFYISDNTTYSSDDVLVHEFLVGPKPIGVITVGLYGFTVPNLPSDDYFLVIVTDFGNDIIELNELDNTTARFFEIISGSGGGCTTSLAGFVSLGEFNGSAYFLSDDSTRPKDAQIIAEQNGGNLAVINSQAENDFLLNEIDEMMYIGLNDAITEGTNEWVNGDAVTIDNFDICSFCNENSNNLDYVVMHPWNGGWSWSSIWNQRKYIVEIPCMVPLVSQPTNSLIAFPNQQTEKVLLNTVFPNPATSIIHVGIDGVADVTTELQIFNAQGQQVLNSVIDLMEGPQTIDVNISELPAGMYYLILPEFRRQDKGKRFMKIRE